MCLVTMIVTLASTSAKNLHDQFTEARCLCRIYGNENGEESLLKDHGSVESYPNWPSSDCNYLHHKCRVACSGKLDLDAYTEDKVKLGLDYCQHLGHPTKSLSPVQLRAEWETEGCRHQDWVISKKSSSLCCGFTSIQDSNRQAMQVFGWNPDCKARTFIIGRGKGL